MIIKEFTFEKKDGSIRTIKGTDDWNSFYKVHPDKKPSGTKPTPSHLKIIYDLEDDTFKTFLRSNFISDRIVGYKVINIKLKDKDFYHKSHKSGNISYIKRRKTPYFLLSLLFKSEMPKSDLVEKLSTLSEKIDISKNQKRNVNRLLRAFKQNDLVKQINNTYAITEKGKSFLENNVL